MARYLTVDGTQTDDPARAATPHRTWALVTRAKGGRFYRPVDGASGMTWLEASNAAAALGRVIRAAGDSSTRLWYVNTETPHAEDQNNILEESGRRVPIRWDAPAVWAAPEQVSLVKTPRTPRPVFPTVWIVPTVWGPRADDGTQTCRYCARYRRPCGRHDTPTDWQPISTVVSAAPRR